MTKYNRKLTANERRSLFGDELIGTTAAYLANPNAQTISDYHAALIGRCASMAASAVLPLYERIAALEAQVAALK